MPSITKKLARKRKAPTNGDGSNNVQAKEEPSTSGLANPSKEASKIVIASDKQGETSATTKPTEKPQQPLESKNDLTEICVVKDNVSINREITVDKEGNNCVPPSNDFSGNPISLDETDYVFYKVENLNMNNDDDDNDEGCKLIIVDLEH